MIEGLDGINLASEGKNCNFTINARFEDMNKIKSQGVENYYEIHKGHMGKKWFVGGLQVEASEDSSKPTISVRSFKDCALILNGIKFPNSLLDLGDNRLLLSNHIISDWQVVAVIQTDLDMTHAFKLPFFDFDKFPYVMTKVSRGGFHLLNVQDSSIQVLVKAVCWSGFVTKSGNRSFDFHFSCEANEEDNQDYNYHYRLPFFEDVITAMEEGQLTFAPHDPIEVIKERSRMVTEKKEAVS